MSGQVKLDQDLRTCREKFALIENPEKLEVVLSIKLDPLNRNLTLLFVDVPNEGSLSNPATFLKYIFCSPDCT